MYYQQVIPFSLLEYDLEIWSETKLNDYDLFG